LCKFQSGFLPGCSTTHHLVELDHIILLALDSKQFTSVTFVDISKAFDTVWIKGLLLNLEKYGIGDNLLIWLNSYLSNRTQKVVIKDALSNIGQLKAGVPHGSVLGSLLFLVFINDIADGMTGLCRLFVDDTSIGHIANDKDSLQIMVNLDLVYLNDWSKYWLVKFNQNKTEIMVFSTRDTKLYFNFYVEGASLRDIDLHKHLGIIFSNDCKWTKNIEKLIEKSSKQLNVSRKLKFKLKRNETILKKNYLHL
jgi:sarcosine oxidase/L-pipecolate oxidase